MPSPVEVLQEHNCYYYVICVLLLRLEAVAQQPAETQEYRDGLEAADWTRH